MTAPDDPRAQAAGECDVAAIGARAAAATKARGVIAERFGENAAVIQHATDAVCESAADVPALLRHIAAEPARVAAAVAAERVRTLREAAVLCREQRTMHRRMGHAQAIDRADGAAGCAEEIDALATPAQGGG